MRGRAPDLARIRDARCGLAGALAALGFKPGDRIGMLALNSDRYLEFFFAMAWGGFVFVPINTRLAPPEIEFWLTDSGCAGASDRRQFPPRAGRFPTACARPSPYRARRRRRCAPRHARLRGPRRHGRPEADAGRGGDDLAGIFYTGGTTGRSKGVMLSHRNIVANALNCAADSSSTRTPSSCTPRRCSISPMARRPSWRPRPAASTSSCRASTRPVSETVGDFASPRRFSCRR